ncbi:hypothetical protein GKE82_00830 [Conexibacter sp. W3-3-2]|uniref:hypothetical protein n=1 Tax=Conexibacter sp. W3-3-2 TaxID=2675227 RepID=UPI0012B82DB7|nr:hypothetical protein [Conexibacter sp. W3-3-2]MTD42884.1 hypothetical protein [Conexibacter sp. W3-3-2]
MTAVRRDLLLAAAALLLSGCTLLLEAGPHDEGLVLAAADRVADGQLPYRDFWWNYGPGQALALGALTWVTGPSLLAWRIARLVLDVAVVLLVARLVEPEQGRDDPRVLGWPLAAGLAAAGALAWPANAGPGPPALALALGALLAARRQRPGLAGALAGLAGLWRPEIGLAAAAGIVLGGAPARRALPAAGAVAAMGVLPFALLAPAELADQTVGFLGIQDLQRLPFPFPVADAFPDPNKLLEAAYPALLVAATAGAAAWFAARRGGAGREAWALAPLVAGGLAYLLARTDEFHLLGLALALAALAGVVGARSDRRGVRGACLAVCALVALHGAERQAGRLLHPGDLVALPGPAADGVRADAAFARGAAFVARTVRAVPGPVLVAPPRYARVRFGAPLLNVLLGRPNPSRYDVVQPGVVTDRDVQEEIARDLARTRTPWVVRWIAPAARRDEPNGGGRLDGADVLDRVIARDYREVARDPSFVVLLRRGYDPDP